MHMHIAKKNKIDIRRSLRCRSQEYFFIYGHGKIILWLKCTEMEMGCRQVNHSRNLWDWVVRIQPYVNNGWNVGKYYRCLSSLWEVNGGSLMNRHGKIILWLKYTEMEMECRQVNHAWNLWDRVMTILPCVNQF